MSAPSTAGVHPRRRAQKASGPHSPPSLGDASSPAMRLRKSSTFSARSGMSSELCSPIDNVPFMPKRSPTNPHSLELLVLQEQRTAQHRDEVAELLRKFDERIQGRLSDDVDASILSEQEVLAVPRFLLDQTVASSTTAEDPMELDLDADKPLRTRENHHHDSDSGIGSSVESPTLGRRSLPSVKSISTSHGAVTKSFTSSSSAHVKKGYELSTSAVSHIEKHIVKPILDEPSLKEFHPLIEDIPRRIGAKFISNLRDLEKTLFFLAPDFSSSPKSFLKFCETSIECLHTTVDLISERDQRLPSDRPYTNNYFLDLVEQIRRYAAIMARTRAKEAKGEALDEMDYSPDEQVVIEGGLTTNGRPAELVRKKNGQSISLVPEGSRGDQDLTMTFKRPYQDLDEENDDDDDPLRSMARRRKGESPGDVMQVCSVCRKEFKRPCDLTKHEKTHSRPWKCSEPKCRYHELGWPTEKERDRHMNDKHSSTPKMYKCKYSPCTYSSKRESNCKQHMEKAHGWTYVRSKSNGRKKAGAGSATPSTPLTPYVATPASLNQTMSTPRSEIAPSPWDAPIDTFLGYDQRFTPAPSLEYDMNRRESITTAGSAMTFSSGYSPNNLNILDNVSPTNDIDFASPMFANDASAAFTFGNAAAFPTQQQPTPALSIGDVYQNVMDPSASTFASSSSSASSSAQHISPTGQGDVTLVGNLADEGYSDDMGFGGDWQLFDNTGAPTNTDALFNDFNASNSGFSQFVDPSGFANFGFDPNSMFQQ